MAAARQLLWDELSFKGPLDTFDNSEDYLKAISALAPIVKGHRLLRQWEDGDEVSSFFEVNLETPAGKGAVTMSEWHTVRNGKLISGRVILDTAPFRSLLPSP